MRRIVVAHFSRQHTREIFHMHVPHVAPSFDSPARNRRLGKASGYFSAVMTAALLTLVSTNARAAAVGEAQPTSLAFPNNSSYVYASESEPYTQYFYPEGSGITDDYYIFEPRDGAETITSAPVVALIHGYGMEGPTTLDELIRHLTRSGITVIWPVYLNTGLFGNGLNFKDWVSKSHQAMERAFGKLATSGHVPVQTDANGRKKFAIVAHSIGTYVAAFVADKAAASGGAVPAPLTMILTDPAGYDVKRYIGLNMSQTWHIDPTTEMVLLSAQDTLLDDQGRLATHTQYTVQDLLTELPIDCSNKSAWVVASDSEQGTSLVSGHLGIQSSHPTNTTVAFDAIDWWGYWPPISAHLKYAFWGTYDSFRHNGGLYAGTWRDATTGDFIRDIKPRFAHPIYPVGYGCP
jgi:hypothetical protein